MPSLIAYLDSSDYSRLSDPRRNNEGLERTRAALLELVDSGQVRCAFSATHISEMAPREPQYTPSATGRTDILVALCGRTALISFDRLLAMELMRLVDNGAPPVQAISYDATWFPEIQDLLAAPVHIAGQLRDQIEREMNEGGLNHEQRRAMKRLFKGNKPGPELAKLFK